MRWSPFAEMSRIERDFRKLFDLDGFTRERLWRPPVDVKENDKEIVVDVELPGVDSKDVKLTVDKGKLTIEGEKKLEKKEEGDYYRAERYYGAFVRSFSLPTSADSEKISASYEKGVLKIIIPKKKEAVPKQIEIKGPN
jgi:HSP20 family protein